MRSAEQIPCPCCSGQLKVIGSRRRSRINGRGEKIVLIIRRLGCVACHRIHHELPDIDLQCRLPHLDRAQTGEYVKRHLAYAGADRDIFSDGSRDPAVDQQGLYPLPDLRGAERQLDR